MRRDSNKDDSSIKKVKKIIRSIIGGILTVYVCLIILVNIPAIQTSLGSWVAECLSNDLGTEVSVGRVDIGLLNRLIIDDLYIADKEGMTLLKSDRTAVKIDIPSIMQGKLGISNAQLFGCTVNLRRTTPQSPLNCQFLIDAFSSDNQDTPSDIDLHVNSLIVRRGRVTYNVLNKKREQTFDTNHLDINHIDATLSMKTFTNDSVNLVVKRFNFIEQNSGLRLRNLQAKVKGNKKETLITDFNLKTHQSSVNIDTLTLHYENYHKDHSFSYRTRIQDSFVTPADFSAFIPGIQEFTAPLYFEAAVDGTENHIDANNIYIHTDNNSMIIALSGYVNKLQYKDKDFSVNISQVLLNSEGKQLLFRVLADKNLPAQVEHLGTINYTGTIHKFGDRMVINGNLGTEAGEMSMDVEVNNKTHVTGLIQSAKVHLGQIMDDSDFGTAAFKLNVDAVMTDTKIPEGTVKGNITQLQYKNHKYTDITINANNQAGLVNAKLTMNDELATLQFNGTYIHDKSQFQGLLNIGRINPYRLGLVSTGENESYSLRAEASLTGNDIDNITGTLDIDSLNIYTEGELLTLDKAKLEIGTDGGTRQITLHSDFADARLHGDIRLSNLVDAFKNQVGLHMPSLMTYKKNNPNRFDFDLHVSDSEILKHFINTGYTLKSPVHASGYIDAITDSLQIDIEAPHITDENNKVYGRTQIHCTGTRRLLSVSLSTIKKAESNATQYTFTADADADKMQTLVSWNDMLSDKTNGMIYATTAFTDSLGKIKADINIHKSQLTVNDTLWQMEPSSIEVYGKRVWCNNVSVHNEDQSIVLNGVVSENPSDSIIADLKNVEIGYVTDLINFHAVRFNGQVSGQAVVSDIYNDIRLNANILAKDLHLQDGRLGNGYIQAFWDKEIKGIRVFGDIIDNYKGLDRMTNVSGFIAPGQNDLDLKISTNNTNAEFLNGFLGSVFKDISGSTNGVIHIIGPLNDINIVGDVTADVDMRLRATNVMYHINPTDTIHLRKYAFNFNDIRISDNRGKEGVVNGTLSHKNMKNFRYDFNIKMEDMTVYDEHEFNSDKFYATVYANATLDIHGADGHPLQMSADVTPTKGSVFAYDAATPDAISTGNFVEFRDATPDRKKEEPSRLLFSNGEDIHDNEENDTTESYAYQGDIYMDISLHVNPNCQIKLRMDNTEDGYITTYGTGNLLAYYHNKSPFTLNGIYQIAGGRYRLYLQDIIYRDLELQTGSNVVFNGNPFDADIHLICHHTINSVPLRDLTSTTGYNQTNKVKVICELDITGKLGNMDFAFDILLPNVSDETRQLVKSLISTDDEMNMQMIYLLGLGRFYTNEYARANGEYGSNQVSTLLSSTISGQINQMLSNVIGQDSKWNFGTGLSTGEQGWNDLDVEGILSGRLLNDRLLINGNFGYRDNAMTNTSTFIGDFDVRWRLTENGNTFIKAYNQTNDRYFTKATLNTQGIGLTYQRDFDSWKALFRKKMKEENNIVKQ